MLCAGWAWGPQRYRTSHRPRNRATCISTYGCSLRTGPSLCSSLFSWSSGFISQAVCIPKMTFSFPNPCSARSLVSERRRFLGRDSALELWPSVRKSWLSLGIRGPLLWISGYFPNIAEGSCPGKGEGNFGGGGLWFIELSLKTVQEPILLGSGWTHTGVSTLSLLWSV